MSADEQPLAAEEFDRVAYATLDDMARHQAESDAF